MAAGASKIRDALRNNRKKGGRWLRASEALEITREHNEMLQPILEMIKTAAKMGETTLHLKDYDNKHKDSYKVRKLLVGLGYGLNKMGTGGPNTKDLVIYW